jgi:predicted NAD-dependent protein-ADP-ribosyltransferase YbiA (DUF1768 family)
MNEERISEKALNTKLKGKSQRERLRSKWEKDRKDVMHKEEHWRKFRQRTSRWRYLVVKDPKESGNIKKRRFI